MNDLLQLLDQIANQTVMVVGDLILDEYVAGAAARISREAPVIVVEEQRRDYLVGGAAMPALNVHHLGGTALQVGIVGPDDAGQRLKRLLETQGVNVGGIIVDPQRRTTTKTRIVAEGFLVFPQQVARVDRLDRHALAPSIEAELLTHLAAHAARCQALLVSDYKNGVVTPGVIAGVRQFAARHQLLLTVDTQGDLARFAGFDLVKCNHHDAARFLGRSLDSEADVQAAILGIHERLAAPEVVITRAAAGISLYSPSEGYHHLPATNHSEVFDVTGAGDTVIAVLTLARAAQASLRDACMLANHAAGVVIRKRGNQPISREELSATLRRAAGVDTPVAPWDR